MKMYRNQNGFTLVELMIAMVGASILALIVATILFMAYRSWSTDNNYARLRRDAAFAVQLMAKEIRSSSYSGISTNSTSTSTSLTLRTNAVRPNVTAFTRSATASNLTYSISNVPQGPVIPRGVRVFNPLIQTNGVLLNLVLVSADGTLLVTNSTFIAARN